MTRFAGLPLRDTVLESPAVRTNAVLGFVLMTIVLALSSPQVDRQLNMLNISGLAGHVSSSSLIGPDRYDRFVKLVLLQQQRKPLSLLLPCVFQIVATFKQHSTLQSLQIHSLSMHLHPISYINDHGLKILESIATY